MSQFQVVKAPWIPQFSEQIRKSTHTRCGFPVPTGPRLLLWSSPVLLWLDSPWFSTKWFQWADFNGPNEWIDPTQPGCLPGILTFGGNRICRPKSIQRSVFGSQHLQDVLSQSPTSTAQASTCQSIDSSHGFSGSFAIMNPCFCGSWFWDPPNWLELRTLFGWWPCVQLAGVPGNAQGIVKPHQIWTSTRLEFGADICLTLWGLATSMPEMSWASFWPTDPSYI